MDFPLNLHQRPLLPYVTEIILDAKIPKDWAFILLFISPVSPNTVTDNECAVTRIELNTIGFPEGLPCTGLKIAGTGLKIAGTLPRARDYLIYELNMVHAPPSHLPTASCLLAISALINSFKERGRAGEREYRANTETPPFRGRDGEWWK